MKQSKKKNKLSGEEQFNEYYEALFGGRWEILRNSLSKEADSRKYIVRAGCEPYFLDSASIRAAAALPLANAHNILDLCAAPGGKTLVLASLMNDDANLLSNERSFERKMRLDKVCATCLPPRIKERVRVINKDGAKLCLANENESFFDAILLDAPCSSERHVFNDRKYLDEWSPSRIKTLAIAQWSLLSSAWRMLKEGGFLLYSTCALNKTENDDIIRKLLKKFTEARLVEPKISNDISAFAEKLPEYEKTEFGAHILPDASGGAGPLYFSLLQKPAKTDENK